jgi:hypothetical protein
VLLFDAGAAVAAAGILITFVVSAVRNTTTLYRLEPLEKSAAEPQADASGGGFFFRLKPGFSALRTATKSGR